jgi:Zn2+/Cd2+-exporting ATPase
MSRYRIQGPDCPDCAAEVESADNETKEPGEEDGRRKRWTIIRIIAAGVLLLVGVIFNGFLHDTPRAVGEYVVLLSAYALVGAPVVIGALRAIMRGKVFNEMFLMTVATGGALVIHQIPEAVGVMLFYAVGEYLQDRAVDGSRRSIASLMDLRPEFARLIENGRRRIVAPEEADVGALIEVLPGERVPLDGEVVEGSSFVNTSSLTGESVPRRVGAGSTVLGGFVNDESRIVVRVGKEFGETAAARILELVENAASHKAPTEKFITRFAAIYTPVVVGVAALVAFLPPLLVPGATLREWVYRALVVLVVSCPCALVVSIPLGYFGGIGGAARNKLLMKGSNCIDALHRVDTVVFDKTGTLTEGVFAVVEVVTRNGFTKDELLGVAAAAESHSPHPLARSIREAADAGSPREAGGIVEVKGHGVIATVGSRRIVVGNDRLLHREGIAHGDCAVEGTVAHVAVDGVYAGYIVVSDRVKSVAAGTIAELKRLGVRKVVMLTGDDASVAGKVAEEIGLDGWFAGLLPDGKVAELEALERDTGRKGAVVFVGDGMNDAPVLVRSDVGFAMGGLGSEAAIEAADVVVMDDDIARVPLAIGISRFTRRIVVENIALALAVKGFFIVLGAVGVADMWEAVIADVGVTLVAVFNALRASGKGRDRRRRGAARNAVTA